MKKMHTNKNQMNQLIINETWTNDLKRQCINDHCDEIFTTLIQISPRAISLNQNAGNSPPGRSRSSGSYLVLHNNLYF